MAYVESETAELKEIVIDDIKKEIIVFANSGGGCIYVGIDNNGTVVGISDSDDELLKITNMVLDSLKPDITMFLNYQIIEEKGKNNIEIRVQRGTRRPILSVQRRIASGGCVCTSRNIICSCDRYSYPADDKGN